MKRLLKRDNGQTALVVCAALLLLVAIFIWFQREINAEVTANTEGYLMDNASALAAMFHTKLDDQLVMLESQTRYFQDVDLSDYNRMKETIKATRGIGEFKIIGVASSAGATMNYMGRTSGNLLLQDYFREAMAGGNAVSATTLRDEEGEDVLALAVPIRQEDAVVGVIYGTFTQEKLNTLVDTVRFSDDGANLLITSDGTLLAKTEGTELIEADAVSLSEGIGDIDINAARGGLYRYGLGGARYVLALAPVGVHGWLFGTIMPESEVSGQSQRIARYMLMVMAFITVVFGGLLYYIYYITRRGERVRQSLTEKAERDPLTGILNKMAFQEATERMVETAQEGEICALYIIDLDDFKDVNDTLGHAMGDRVLTEAADKLRRIFREGDLVGRIGGDEFAACLRCPVEHAGQADKLTRSRAEAVLRDMAQTYEKDGKAIAVSVSVGVACYPQDGRSAARLYENADKALYIAKRGGKNRYEVYE